MIKILNTIKRVSVANKNNIFNSTNSLKILTFLAENTGNDFLGIEIQHAISVSRAGVYIAIHELIKQGLVTKIQKGKTFIYSLANNNPIVKQIKVLLNIKLLESLVLKLSNSSKKIILYGSSSRGEDYKDSDLDIFVLSKEPLITQKIINNVKMKRKIQAIIKTPAEMAEFNEKEKVFIDEINRGIIIWEEKQ